MSTAVSTTDLRPFPDLAAQREAVLALVARSEEPLYLADRRVLADRHQALARALDTHWPAWTLAYSFKTNYQIAESGALRALGVLAEVVSGHEYRLARRLGYRGDEIVFNGPYKTPDDLRTAIADGARVNVDGPQELQAFEDIARALNKRCAVGLRVNVPLSAFPPSRFGFSVGDGEALAAARRVWDSPHLRLAGLHLHVRGDLDNPAWYREAADLLAAFLLSWPAERRAALDYLDLGSGFPSNMSKLDSRPEWDPKPIGEYVAATAQGLAPCFDSGAPKPRLIHEPGRYLVNDAIVFVSRVVSVRDRAGRQQVVCNGATTMLPFTRHRAPIVRVYRPDLTPHEGGAVPSTLLGATCREDDVLYQGALARVQAGDLVVHYGVGAYNASITPAFIYPCPLLRFIDRA